jgi:CSLREA domain-containing protein
MLVAFTVLLALLSVLVAGGVRPAYGAAFTVTKTADTNDGSCDADCSLREAIVAANAAAGDDEITLPLAHTLLPSPEVTRTAPPQGI